MFLRFTSHCTPAIQSNASLAAVAMLTLLSTATITSAEPPLYRVVELGLVEGEYPFFAQQINENGMVIGRYIRGDEDGFTFRPAVWFRGVFRTLPEGFQTSDFMLTALDDHNNIVGWENDSLPWGQGFATDGRRILHLGTLGGNFSYAYGINNRGTIVGHSAPPLPNDDQRAFIWSNGEMAELPHLSTTFSKAHAVNDSMNAVGTSWDEGSNQRAVLWPAGGSEVVPLTPGVNRGFPEVAVDINNSNQIAGDFAIDDPVSWVHAFFWEDGVMTDIGVLPEAGQQGPFGPELVMTRAKAMNDLGQVVGNSEPHFPDPEFDNRPGPFFWENGEIFNLNDYIDFGSGDPVEIFKVNDITNAQVILATVTVEDSFIGRSVILVPMK